ncbi:MAG TPA: peptidoglycan bridge formation glycyltransferase FemA/FemB family protein [Prolixibacteraceae bacterium]|nr:peptidoglycan bridge formation glycyltransferase FemA/FemB family protein [Bacteroidales bacterium]HNQ36530.1 peptidoglycan bridge formation glycyltransferase FemA/FemB family protein [Prolixibacteraceae bacterium]HRV88218.1 peptidoglycan bridge formation glycyltransferase FemA/FemB family protein [Prolixibacteraceae bacterium]
MLSQIMRKETRELYRTPILQQTAFWSDVKNQLGLTSLAIDFRSDRSGLFTGSPLSGHIHSDLLVLIMPLGNGHSLAYVPYGPELEPGEEAQGPFLEELTESLRSFLPAHCIAVRYDLFWESWWAREEERYDDRGFWLGEPQRGFSELRFNFNTIRKNFRKAHFNILPANTIFIDLKPELETILHRMKPKTRYNIGLAFRKGVSVRSAGLESIDTWYELYRETAIRNRLTLNDVKYFEAILKARAESTSSPAEVHLLIAEEGHTPLAALFLILSGNRGCYLYGASSDAGRNKMATYALQWEAIRISRERGCTGYDMFGVAPNPDPSHPLYGLYKFKSGFGGNIYHSMGCWDYPLNEEEYVRYLHTELTSKGYHLG